MTTQTAPAMHTPGDWRLDIWEYPGANPPRKDLVICNEQKLLATVAWDEGTENPYTIPRHEALANAALIKAAPKLLRAMRKIEIDCREVFEGREECTPDLMYGIVQLCRRTIALAENRTA